MGTSNISKEPKKEDAKEEIPSVQIEKIRLFHGSVMEGIKIILPAKDETIGHGTYFTSQRYAAEIYALNRSSGLNLEYKTDSNEERLRKHIVTPVGPQIPVVYEVEVENLKLADIRTQENFKSVMKGYRDYLIDYRKKFLKSNLTWDENIENDHIDQAIGTIDVLEGNASEFVGLSKYKHLSFEKIAPKDILQYTGRTFTEYLMKKKYDGILAIEGGERESGQHDSYVIFDPEKIKIIETVKIVKSETHSEVLK